MADSIESEREATARAVGDHLWPKEHAAAHLGIELVEMGPGSATLTMTVRPEMANAHDVCQGGFTFTLVDMAMGLAINSFGEVAFASGAEIDFVNPALVGSTLTATARVIHRRGRSAVTDGSVTNDDGSTIALFRGRTRSIGRPVIPA